MGDRPAGVGKACRSESGGRQLPHAPMVQMEEMKWTKTGMGQRGCPARSRTGRKARGLTIRWGSLEQRATPWSAGPLNTGRPLPGGSPGPAGWHWYTTGTAFAYRAGPWTAR
ncbi:hypothetical protein CENSYa_0735 [Cenarchaeum symbiosum A]|uniref:Uncharacterized protein n=1 Tax=Cenarchaeum symbiosum (strain A) TaxID=414004 RepID=A0RVI6_CENSY|nr:hypothetical protein CENSYa_0720 [Cenarchaeum symbiosum A]ABK77368.1 hypothetical protein CENSYa_0735 [Cenarchaeum symbiosum A]